MIKAFSFTTVRSLQLFQLLRFASFFIVGIYFAKSSISIAEIGTYETLMLLAGAVSYFWVSGILNSYLASYSNLSHEDRKSSHFNIFLVLSAISLFIIIVLFCLQNGVVQLLTNKGELKFYQLILIYILFNNPSYITEHIFLLHQKSKEIVLYGFASFIGTIATLCLPIYFHLGLEKAILYFGLFSLVKYVFAFIITSSYSLIKINKSLILSLLKISTPLMLSFIVTGSAQYIDGYLVSKFFGKIDLAIFRYGSRELPFSLLLANALSLAMVPQLANKENLNVALLKLKSESSKLIIYLFPISILLMIGSKWFYPLLFNENFTQSAGIFNIYILLISSRFIFPQSILIAKNENNLLLKISIIELIINVLVSITLMFKLGMIGIAYGTVIAFAMEKIMLIYMVKVKWKLDMNQYIPFNILLPALCLLFLTFIILIFN